ncbi:TenA family protein [Nonomuraea sp. NBC_01738]|uniref:TenA family protein n=1 Tax=Nonomuraea sp. NBC_01738 TaxID=2976003 RepID=UPI002E120182|nr:TenA family protein [Nonomuraea sp. NBC_01738]
MFSDDVWARTGALLQAIHTHPFNTALGDGTLSRERFAFYIVQDARYLEAFSKALATASVRASDPGEAAFWAQSAHAALAAERTLHEGYIDEYGLSAADLLGVRTSPTCLAYSSFLEATALSAPYPVLAAAVLPCFWVYQDVGEALQKHSSDSHPYRAWISTYADPEFAASVATAKGIVDRVAAPGVYEDMAAAFVRATEYEWMFWDSAWRLEAWPTSQWV